MLESVVSTLLNRVLGTYVSNLDASQLKIGIWSGEVTLRDLKLRREALDNLDLPVDVLEGYLGELKLSIPWNNLGTKPVIVNLKDVYVLAIPRTESTMTMEEQKEREYNNKIKELESFELLQEATNKDDKDDTFVNQLVTKVLNNLQFSIANIHIRYEDDSSTNHRFAAGLTLKELSAVTTDESWTPKTITDSVSTIYKLANMESLSVYWDTDTPSLVHSPALFQQLIATKDSIPKEHQYILKPVTGTGKLTLHKNFGSTVPKIDTSLIFENLAFVIDNEQYHDAILMVDTLHAFVKRDKYKLLHPKNSVRDDPLGYFKFAGNAVLSEIHERNERWTWKKLSERRDDRKMYIECYVDQKLEKVTPKQKETLEKLERKLSLDDIKFYRSLAKPKLRSEKARLAVIKKKKQEAASNQKWNITSWWGSNKKQDNGEEQLVITEEQKQEFYSVIDYDEDQAKITAAVNHPKDTMMLCLKAQLNKCSFTIRNDPHKTATDLVSFELHHLSMDATKYVESLVASVTLDNIGMFDTAHPDSPYYQLMSVRRDEESICSPFFNMKFESKPLDGRADSAIALHMRPTELVFNPYILVDVRDFFKPPETSAESINALVTAAGAKLQSIGTQTRASLEFALDQHKTLDLQLDMVAPIIIVPQDCKSKNSSGMVINVGHFIVKSNLAPSDALAQIKRHSISELESNIELQKLIYDRFTVQLKQAKILVGDSVQKCLKQVYDSQADLECLQLVDDIDINLSVELCVMQRSSFFPRCRVNGEIPLLKVNFSDAKYKALMQIPLMLKEAGLTDDSPQTARVVKVEGNKIDRRWFNTMDVPIWKQDTSALLLESESESSEDEKNEVEIISENNCEERVIQLDFRIEQFLACISESHGVKETLLCEVDLQRLQVNMDKRFSEMKLQVSLHSLDVKDCMEDGHQFSYLVTSNKKVLQLENEDIKGLIDIEFIQCDPTSPNYDTKYKRMDQTIHVTVSTFIFIVTRSSILTLQNFATRTFANDSNKEVSKKDITPQQPKKINSSNMCARVLLDSVNVVLNSEGKKLATAELSLGDLSVVMTEGQINLATKFANLVFTDNFCVTPESGILLSIQGDQLVDFRYNSFINDGRSEYPGYDHGIYLRMGSAQINVLEPSIKRLQVYAQQFTDMQATYSKASKAAKQAAQDSAKQVSQVADKLHFDILVSTPVITLPDTVQKDKIVAHLGELYASNSFQGNTNQIRAGLRAIKLESQFYHVDNKSHTLSILDKVDIDFVVKMTAEGLAQPDLDVDGQIQDINVHLTDRQYAFLIQFANQLSNSSSEEGNKAKKLTNKKDMPKEIKDKDSKERRIQFGLNVKSIGLELFKDTNSIENSITPPSLTRIGIYNISTSMTQSSNSAIEGDFTIGSLSMDDTRLMIPTKFKHVMPMIEDGNQLVVKMEKTKLISVTLKDPKIILSLEHLLLIRDFFVLPTSEESRVIHTSESPKGMDMSPEEEPAGDMSFMIKVLHPEVILLAQSDREDTEALILSIDEVMLSKQAQTSISVTQFGLYLCNMNNRKETTLQCLQNFDFNFSMSKERLALSLDPLILQLSYGDIMLISDIVNKALALGNNNAAQSKTSDHMESQDLEKKSSANPQKKTTPQEIHISVGGAQLVLIEELHQTPIIDMALESFNLQLDGLSQKISTSLELKTHINYFNIKNSHWEPLLEPWGFTVSVNYDPNTKPTTLGVYSGIPLNVNVTHAFLESTMSSLKLITEQKGPRSGKRKLIAPFELVNKTGYTLKVWNESNGASCSMKNEETVPWWFEDWKSRREITSVVNNNLNIEFQDGSWDILNQVNLDMEGAHVLPLKPVLGGVQHRIVFDIKLVDNVKRVTIRSGFVIRNRTRVDIDVGVINPDGRRDIQKVLAGNEYAIPIENVNSHRFCIRPDEHYGYDWTENQFYWKDFLSPGTKPNIRCMNGQNNTPPFLFQVNANVNKNCEFYGQYPCMSLEISPPIEIENKLPFELKFHLVDKTSGFDFGSKLAKADTLPIHVIDSDHLLLLSVEVENYNKSEHAIIHASRSDGVETDSSLEIIRGDKSRLHIRVNCTEVTGGTRRYTLVSPYLIVNKTGLPIQFKTKPAWTQALSSTENLTVCPPNASSFMYSYAKFSNGNRTLVQVGKSGWSQPLSFEAVGSKYDAIVAHDAQETHIGVSIQEGLDTTKVVTFAPRFVLSNQTSSSLRFGTPGTSGGLSLESGKRVPLHDLPTQKEINLALCLYREWSAPFNIQDIGTSFVRVKQDDDNESLLRVQTVLQDATIFIVVQEETEWPYLIVNNTETDMMFYQKTSSQTKRYSLNAGQSVPYAWDLPSSKEKNIVLSANGKEYPFNFQEIGTLVPFKHTTTTGQPYITSIDIKIHGGRRVLELSKFEESKSHFKKTTHTDNKNDGFEAAEVDMTINSILRIELVQVGLSLINRHLQEVMFACIKGFDCKLTDSALYHSLRLNVAWVQIDNQMEGAEFPIVLYPTNLTGDTKDKVLPMLQVGLDRVKDNSHGVQYFKYFSVLLQEMSIEIEESFIHSLLDFVQVDTAKKTAANWKYTTEIPEVQPIQTQAQIYFEVFSIQPIQLNISFLRSDTPIQSNSPLSYFVNAITMTMGNINDAPIKFNALVIENMMADGSDLSRRISRHYIDQSVFQVHRILGSADFLGNPVGLFNNLSSGVAELFYEPWQGLIMSDKPQDLGYGIAKGFSGFVKKSVFGVSDSVTKITGSIGKGLSTITMDTDYQNQRRKTMSRNKPKHALGGVVQGANSFASSITSGYTGLVTRPMEGAKKEGFGGFFKGFGKGLVGAVTKPVVGTFDLASTVTQGIRNTATDDTNLIDRTRYPRYMASDGILKPYDKNESMGRYCLKEVEEGKYANEEYISFCQSIDTTRVTVLTSQRILLIQPRTLNLERQVALNTIKKIEQKMDSIDIYNNERTLNIQSEKIVLQDFMLKLKEASSKK
ncbi:hypothetical protein K501DRAFT_320796 [Backusella circina FSU 941]|nr:hypothetical protein K501DRAFT_320796 [Backusella circina FSU 941]